MNDAEYRLFLDDVCARYDAETAARIIEDHCRGPYKPPRRGTLFPPASSGDRAAGGAGAAAGPGDGAA